MKGHVHEIDADFLVMYTFLVVIEDLVGILKNSIDDSDLPASICNIRACAHQRRSNHGVNAMLDNIIKGLTQK